MTAQPFSFGSYRNGRIKRDDHKSTGVTHCQRICKILRWHDSGDVANDSHCRRAASPSPDVLSHVDSNLKYSMY